MKLSEASASNVFIWADGALTTPPLSCGVLPGVTREAVLELDQSEAIKQAVIACLGLALLPAVSVVHEIAAGRLAVLRTPFLPLSRPLSFVLHRRRHRDALLKAFLASVGVPADARA